MLRTEMPFLCRPAIRRFRRAVVRGALICLSAASFGSPAVGAVVTLYDGSAGSLPSDQGSLTFFSLGGSGSQTAVTSGVRLQSDLAAGTGYSNHSPFSTPGSPILINPANPAFDTATGFELAFALRIADESHTSDDRAGWSVTMIAANGRGIELGFWRDRIFAQSDSPLFVAAENVLFDTVATDRQYVLSIRDDAYALSDGTTPLLAGSLRDYSGFGSVPYTLSNYLFLGDNTRSGSVDADLGRVTLRTDTAAVPEPGTAGLVTIGIAIGIVRRRQTSHRRVLAART